MFRLARPILREDLAELVCSSGWARPRDGGARLHRSLDFPCPTGTPVRAVDAGVVIVADRTDNSAAGKWVGVRHRSGLISRYMHFDRVDVDVDQEVGKGSVLGLSGNTGSSEGPHLHLNLRVPEAMLDDVAGELGGVPKSGWGSADWGSSYSIPGEPFIPCDRYRDIVRSEAAAQGIPLYRRRFDRELVAGGIILGIGIAAHLLLG